MEPTVQTGNITEFPRGLINVWDHPRVTSQRFLSTMQSNSSFTPKYRTEQLWSDFHVSFDP